jgi:hypothetical protein
LVENASIPKPIPNASSSLPDKIDEDVVLVSDRSPDASPSVMVAHLVNQSLAEDSPSQHEDRQPSPPSATVLLPADSNQSSDLHIGPPLVTDNSPAAALQESVSQDAGEFNSVVVDVHQISS